MLGWIYFIFIGILLLATFVIGSISIGNPNLTKGKYSKSLIPGLVVISVAFIAFSLLMPVVMPQFLKIVGDEIKEYNELGDAVGGLMNPFIAIAAVIVTGLAFYMQYQANQQIRDQFKLQQFESQFYEMLRIHMQNLENLSLSGFNHIIEIGGQSSQYAANPELLAFKGREVITVCVQEINSTIDVLEKVKEQHGIFMDKLSTFHLAYIVFFDGLDYVSLNVENLPLMHKDLGALNANDLNTIVTELKKIRVLNKELENDYHGLPIRINHDLFKGRHNILGHYFRHLYLAVAMVAEKSKDLLTYEEKRQYLRIMRAQLSVYEQVLLYYNWLGKYGQNWETSSNIRDKASHKYFTDYRMIHNLSDEFIHSTVKAVDLFKEKYSQFMYEKGRKDTDTLFAIYGITSDLS